MTAVLRRSANMQNNMSSEGIKKKGNTPKIMAKVMLNASLLGAMPLVKESFIRCKTMVKKPRTAYIGQLVKHCKVNHRCLFILKTYIK